MKMKFGYIRTGSNTNLPVVIFTEGEGRIIRMYTRNWEQDLSARLDSIYPVQVYITT